MKTEPNNNNNNNNDHFDNKIDEQEDIIACLKLKQAEVFESCDIINDELEEYTTINKVNYKLRYF